MKKHARTLAHLGPAVALTALLVALIVPARSFVSQIVSGAPVPDSVSMRIEISLIDRRLWVLDDDADTLLATDVAVGSGRRLSGIGRTWTFATPRGTSVVARKDSNPLWVPPDWHYVEAARDHGLRVEQLSYDRPYTLRDGAQIVVRDNRVGVMTRGDVFRPFATDQEIVRDGILFIPPYGTVNRMVPGVLGEYRLLLANGVSLHGTPEQSSIGKAVTHGCIRLRDDDIRWLYQQVPLGARVDIR